MANKEWCRHYTGALSNTSCEAGVEYDAVRDTTQKPFHLPCTDPAVRDRCVSFEAYTDDEIAKHNRAITGWMQHLADFGEKKRSDCPQCKQEVTQLVQVGRCVYCNPCGHRLWQGVIPAAWKRSEAGT